MGTGRKFSKKPVTRPKKGAAGRASRTKVQKARLAKIGFDVEELAKMNCAETKDLLKKYAKKSTRREVASKLKK